MVAYPTDPYQVLHFNMVHVHQTFKDGYECIALALNSPPLDDLQNFLGYCESWVTTINSHHESEEEVLFPFLNQKMDFSGEAEQHEVIHDNLRKLLTMIRDAQTDASKFDGAAMKALVSNFKEPLFAHLDDEIEHIQDFKLKEAQFTGSELTVMWAALEKYAQSHADMFLTLPFMLSHTPPELKGIWPPLPWAIRKILIPYVLALRHSGYWKYAPYAMS